MGKIKTIPIVYAITYYQFHYYISGYFRTVWVKIAYCKTTHNFRNYEKKRTSFSVQINTNYISWIHDDSVEHDYLTNSFYKLDKLKKWNVHEAVSI